MAGHKRTQEEFVAEVKEKRPDVTVLSKFTKSTDLVRLLCQCGWEYEQSPHNLFRNRKGCPICGNASNTGVTTETFIERGRRIHNGFYDYSKVVYENAHTPVIIICPVHGEFRQRPNNHLSGQGCAICGNERAKDFVGWTYTRWKDAGLKSKNFTGFKLYKVRCYDPNTGEEFLKIGKTFIDIAKRFYLIPYEYEVLEVTEGSARFISELEVKVQQSLKNRKYRPKIPFAGMTECFTVDEILIVKKGQIIE